MKDFLGNEVKIGDTVAFYIRTSTSGGFLSKGVVTGFWKRGGYEGVNVKRNKREFGLATHKIVKL